jgi:hypothetical protein
VPSGIGLAIPLTDDRGPAIDTGHLRVFVVEIKSIVKFYNGYIGENRRKADGGQR